MSNLNMITPLTVQGIINKFCYTIGMLPTSYKQSLTYEEQLLAIGHYLETTIYPAINNNATALAELQQLFVALQDYVNNYFDNLDIQNEVNQKIEAMAESGELAEIITAYLQLNGLICFNTLDEMKNAENLVEGSYAKTYGKNFYNDGYGNFYKIRQLTNTDIIDNDNIIAVNFDENLIAEKLKDHISFNVENAYKQNKFKPIVNASMYMIDDNEDTIKARILKWKEMKVNSIIVLINFANDNSITIRDDLTKVENLMNYAKSNNINIDTIKFHCPMGSTVSVSKLTTYESQVNYVLTTLNATTYGINRLTLFNELPYVYSAQGTAEVKAKAIDIIENLQDLGYQVGITCSNLELGIGNMIKYSPELCDVVDFFAFNYYQCFPFKKELTTEEDSIEAWDKSLDAIYTYKTLYPDKPIILSETGVLNNWLNMMNPADYNLNQFPANGKTYPLYFYGLFNNKNANTYLNEVWLWYDEVMTNYQDTIDFIKMYLGGE